MKAGPLWQISVTTTVQAEEAVAALLERLFGQPASVYTQDGQSLSVATVHTAQMASKVSCKREALAAGLEFLRTCDLNVAPAKILIRKVPREFWSKSWKKYFKAIVIGSALLVKPSWNKRPPRKGAAVVTLDPGLSFGTGQHPTTAFCLTQLVKARKTGQAQSFLDIGTGSGILAIAAVKLGYRPVRAFDLDRTAVRVAKANARKNRIQHSLAIVRQDLNRAPLQSRARYDLICANLVDDLLIQGARRILNWLRPGGRLVVAGVLASQFEQVRKTYETLGLTLESTRLEGGWQSGAFVAVG